MNSVYVLNNVILVQIHIISTLLKGNILSILLFLFTGCIFFSSGEIWRCICVFCDPVFTSQMALLFNMNTSGEVLVFYLPICFFYYLAKLIIFIRSSRIHCIFFLEGGFKGIYLRERNFTLSYVVSEI